MHHNLVQAKVPLLNVAHHLEQKDYNSVLRYAYLAEDVTEETGEAVAARSFNTVLILTFSSQNKFSCLDICWNISRIQYFNSYSLLEIR